MKTKIEEWKADLAAGDYSALANDLWRIFMTEPKRSKLRKAAKDFFDTLTPEQEAELEATP